MARCSGRGGIGINNARNFSFVKWAMVALSFNTSNQLASGYRTEHILQKFIATSSSRSNAM